MRDLAASMGLCTTSLYNAFGDKRTLFKHALERYLDDTVRKRIRRLELSFTPLDAVRAFVEEIIARSLVDRQRRGCFLINSALDVAPHDKELGAVIAARLAEIEDFFRRCLTRARAEGALAESRDPDDLARLLLGVVLGIRVLARSNPARELLEGVARPALALLNDNQMHGVRE